MIDRKIFYVMSFQIIIDDDRAGKLNLFYRRISLKEAKYDHAPNIFTLIRCVFQTVRSLLIE